MTNTWTRRLIFASLGLICLLSTTITVTAGEQPAARKPPAAVEARLRGMLDAPLLFVKRHSYTGIHIYDMFYKWPPGGGGIYVIENPSAPRPEWKVRPVIDPTTPGTLGLGVYSHPDLSWDAKRLLFCFKGEPTGSTSIYEIGVDGRGLRRVTDPTSACDCYKGAHGGQHDIAPAYLSDGRIVCVSARPSGLVPCANAGVTILHVMNADGSDMHPISVNNVTEFDPTVLPDGRLLFGRWEYVDKNALTIQSLWTMNPDGTQETALYANNMVFPEAILDARPVPGSTLIVGSFTKHNGPPRGSIALVDPRVGKNDPRAITNLEHPADPTHDRGNSCEPWPLSEDVFLFSGRPAGHARNAIEMIDRAGHRIVVHSDPEICLHSPMLLKPRLRPAALADTTDRQLTTGRFFLQDIHKGLAGVKPGEVKWLRVVEETSRVSPTPGGRSPYNQTFLVSCALAFGAKNYLGVVPVEPDGSAYFEVPSGRAVYLQALDAEGRLIQSMRTFVQAAPGTTRSCIGCHEHKFSAAANAEKLPAVLERTPSRLVPESWGSGYLDYPGMVQPVLDKHCVRCHGGEEGIAAGMDLSGGWTEHFSIGYENLTNRCETQLVAYWISGIDCMNGTAWWSSQIFAPRKHGSAIAPLAKLLMEGHDGQIPDLSRKERDLLMAWIDGNGLYHGTWDYTEHGCAIKSWAATRNAVVARMKTAGCLQCHGDGNRPFTFENDWINLQQPERSRILRAPLAKGADGMGLGLCRQRKVDPGHRRLRLLWNGYAHAVQPVDRFARRPIVPYSAEGEPVVSFSTTADPRYRALLAAIRKGREVALAEPRVDMPGAEVIAGASRNFVPPPLPETAPAPVATLDDEGLVRIAWERSARTIGLEAELHRGDREGFTPGDETLLTLSALGRHVDRAMSAGRQHYALVMVRGQQRSKPAYASVTVPPPPPPAAPTKLEAAAASYCVRLRWQRWPGGQVAYHVYRRQGGAGEFVKITEEPVRHTAYADAAVEPGVAFSYVVRAVSRRGALSSPTATVTATARIVKEPVFVVSLEAKPQGIRQDAEPLPGRLHGKARTADGTLDLTQGGHLTFSHQEEFDLAQPISVECWVWFERRTRMPVFVSCGHWNQSGWFLQWLGDHWRWHVGGLDCDGGTPATGRWIHLVGTHDGRTLRLFQDGVQVAEKTGQVNPAPFPGALHVGQYAGGPAPEFQMAGRMRGVKIYHRAVTAPEAAAAAKKKP